MLSPASSPLTGGTMPTALRESRAPSARTWTFVLGFCSLLAACAARGRYVTAHYESPPDELATIPPCELTRWSPGKEPCRGTGHSTTPTTITGGWEGKTEYQYGWLSHPSGVTYARAEE